MQSTDYELYGNYSSLQGGQFSKMADDEENNSKHLVFVILVKYNKT